MSAQQGQQIDVTSLSPPELLEVRQQLTSELEHLTSSYASLRSVQARFTSCIQALKHLPSSSSSSSSSQPSLIPLSSSLYVPGTLAVSEDEGEAARVIVDVGTGYYVEKTVSEAEEMYKGKVTYVGENVEKLQQTIERKQDNLRVVGEILQMKTAQLRQQQQQQDGPSAVAAS
ncbi:unnamed protein product [Parajaminaea phylloscopi]